MYLWKYDYAMTAAKATTAVGASFLVGLILAMLQAKPHLASKEVVAGLGKRLDYDRGAAVEPDGDGALPE